MAQGWQPTPARRGRARGRVRVGWSAALLASVAVLTTGCAIEGSPSTVAYVGDGRVTQRQLDSALAAVQTTLAEGQQVSPQAVVNVLIQGVAAEEIGRRNGVTVTDAQRDAILQDSNLVPLLADPTAKQVAYDIADQQLVAQAVGAETYLQQLQATDVELNPRYGVLDPTSKTILDGQSSSLSLPAAGS